MKNRLCIIAALSAVAAVVVAQTFVGAPFQSHAALHVLRDSVQTLQGAYIMLPPEPVIPDVDSFEWSPDGTRLAVLTRSRDEETKEALKDLSQSPGLLGEVRLSLVDAKTMKVTPVTGVEIGQLDASVQWFDGMEFFVLGMSRQIEAEEEEGPNYATSLHLVNAATGRARLLGEAPNETSSLFLEPLDPGRLLLTTAALENGNWRFKTSTLDSKGRLQPTLPGLDEALNQDWNFGGWSKKYGVVLLRKTEVAVLLPSGAVQPLDAATYREERRALSRLAVPEDNLEIEERNSIQGQELWLIAKPDMGVQPAAMVCSVTETSALSPAKNGVAYTSQRMLWIRRMIFMDGEKFAKLRREAVINDASYVAKQVGTAIQIYSMDYDDTFPTGDFAEILGPYAKDPGLFSRFNFSMPNGLTTDLKDPSKTPLGHVQTDIGRAIVFADGHVEWQDRTP